MIEKQLTLTEQKTIRFYRAKGKYGFLSNLYMHPILFEDKLFPTSEHAYQYGKYKDPKTRAWVMEAPYPHLVAIISHNLFVWDIVEKWSKMRVNRMYYILKTKFKDPHLAKRLLDTKETILLEDSSMDPFWGIGKKGTGKNMLGKLLMKVREELREGKIKTRKLEHKIYYYKCPNCGKEFEKNDPEYYDYCWDCYQNEKKKIYLKRE